eukprot:302103-Prymnesium_polylepis.1
MGRRRLRKAEPEEGGYGQRRPGRPPPKSFHHATSFHDFASLCATEGIQRRRRPRPPARARAMPSVYAHLHSRHGALRPPQ